MDNIPGSFYLWIALLILLSAFFSASEAALLSVSRLALKNQSQKNPKLSEKVLLLKEKANNFISALLIGNNLVNILLTSLFTNQMIRSLDEKYAILVSTIFCTIIIVILGEMIPKSLGTADSLKTSQLVYYPVEFFIKLFYPLVWILNGITTVFHKAFSISNSPHPIIGNQQGLEAVIDISQEEGIIENEERSLIKSVFEFSDTEVDEIMVPRVDMICLDIEDGIEKFLSLINETDYSRIPVYEKSIDNILGILFVKDVFRYFKISDESDKKDKKIDIRKIMKKAYFVPESKKVDDLFREMREKRQHMMLVVDEYGGISGLVTMEDILEELVGEIQDEFDREDPFYEENPDHSYIIAGNYPIDELNELLHLELPEEEFDTISGFLLAELGHIPIIDELVEHSGYVFTIKQIKNRRILQVHVKRMEENAEP